LVIFFLISLLNIFKAPTFTIWLLAIFASEYSIVFIGLTTSALLTDLHTDFYALVGTIIGLISLILFLSPIIRAYFIAQKLPNEMEKALGHYKISNMPGDNHSASVPFNVLKLFQTVPKVPFRSYTYVTHNDTSLTLDYYSSVVAGKRPCVVAIHGGSWISGNSKQLPELNSHLVRAGYHVVAINYRLAPRWKCPAPIEDTTAALKYLRNHADELNIDVDNFILLGRSAGGQIALLSAYTLEQLGIKGVIDFYGPADMIWGYMTPSNPLVLNSKRTLARYVGGDYYEIPEKYAASSPIEFVNQNTVPTLILHGAIDVLVFDAHGHRLVAKLNHHKIPHYFLQLPWATHGFDYHLYGPGGQLSTYAIEHFLHVVTRR
jgi:acetyl esterase/lipase